MSGRVAAALVLSVGALAARPPAGTVSFERSTDRIEVRIDGRPFTTYYFSPDLPRPFFHPLRAADGTIVTRGYPMQADVPGEENDRDHVHHRSLWFTHGDVDGIDFWAESGQTLGRIVHRSVDRLEEGRRGILETTMDWIGPAGRKVLTQKTRVTFDGDAARRRIDFAIELAPAGGDVVFADTKEGSFAVRLATALKEARGGTITNSAGGAGEKACWGKNADWVDYSGTLEGKKLGVAIFDHPESFRHPTPWHVRAYGLFAANPFGLKAFTRDPKADGSFRLARGQTLRLRYRVLIHPGDASGVDLRAEYRDFTERPG